MAEIITQATVTVPAGSGSRTVSGVFGSSAYMVRPQAAWATAFGVSGKTASQFVVSFGAAPLVDSDMDYTVIQLS